MDKAGALYLLVYAQGITSYTRKRFNLTKSHAGPQRNRTEILVKGHESFRSQLGIPQVTKIIPAQMGRKQALPHEKRELARLINVEPSLKGGGGQLVDGGSVLNNKQ